MKECQTIVPFIFINATLAAACKFSLAHKLLNFERLKAEVLADDARVDLNDAILNFNLVHDQGPSALVAGNSRSVPSSDGVRCVSVSLRTRPSSREVPDVILFHLLCKPGNHRA